MAKINFQTALERLKDESKPIPQTHLSHYSDLDLKSLESFKKTWQGLTLKRKISLLEQLQDTYEDNMLVSYDDLARELLSDSEGEVRARAICLLREENSIKNGKALIKIAKSDPFEQARIEAILSLGFYIYLDELKEISGGLKAGIEDLLTELMQDESHPLTARAALESLSYSSRAGVDNLIAAAYKRHDPEWIASALRAMHHSQDDEKWQGEVISKLMDENETIRLAAIRAAGGLGLGSAVAILISMLEDEEIENEEAFTVIWSLSEIGGEDAQAYLIQLMESAKDEEMSDFIEDALENMRFSDLANGNFDLADLGLDEDFEEEDEEE